MTNGTLTCGFFTSQPVFYGFDWKKTSLLNGISNSESKLFRQWSIKFIHDPRAVLNLNIKVTVFQ
ncbi:hypothetical protein B472_02960 [Limnohabitans sp. Rim28]|nr:hypothetical protein B472_02960 [Limnohabitans sp. Rim28]